MAADLKLNMGGLLDGLAAFRAPLRRFYAVALALCCIVDGSSRAQPRSASASLSTGVPQAPVITFEAIARAESSLGIRAEQVRRVLEAGPDGAKWVGIRESLISAPTEDGGEPRFVLGFVGLQNEFGVDEAPVPPAEVSRRERLFRAQAGYLQRFASLRISDPARAAENYAIVYLDSTVRLGRAIHRVAVLPRRLGRNPWVLEIDATSNYPLFRAEFDATGQLVSTLEVTRFELLDPAQIPDANWWAPTRPIEVFANLQDALTATSGHDFTVPAGTDLPPGYLLSQVRVTREDLRDEVNLLLTYSDGLDDFFVVETSNVPPPTLPAPAGGQPTYAIAVYQDRNISQLMFHLGSTRTLVVGRAGQFQLGPFTASLLARSLAR